MKNIVRRMSVREVNKQHYIGSSSIYSLSFYVRTLHANMTTYSNIF